MSQELIEALKSYDDECAKCPVRQNDVRSQKECRLCGATTAQRCGQDNPYPLIQTLRAAIKNGASQ